MLQVRTIFVFQKPLTATVIDQAQKAEITTVSVHESIADSKSTPADKSDSDIMQESGAGGENLNVQESDEKSNLSSETDSNMVQESASDGKSETT